MSLPPEHGRRAGHRPAACGGRYLDHWPLAGLCAVKTNGVARFNAAAAELCAHSPWTARQSSAAHICLDVGFGLRPTLIKGRVSEKLTILAATAGAMPAAHAMRQRSSDQKLSVVLDLGEHLRPTIAPYLNRLWLVLRGPGPDGLVEVRNGAVGLALASTTVGAVRKSLLRCC
jgi:hypothetical protein